jgi:RHS repeat-associated protein
MYSPLPVRVYGAIPGRVKQQSWLFDSRGNWERWTSEGSTQSRTHNEVNELLTRDGVSLAYDDNGNMTSDDAKAYVWDEENRLSSVNGAYYQYDALGRRISKTVAGVTTQYIYDGWQVVQESSNLGVTKLFTYGNYIDEPVCMVTTTATRSDTVYYLQGNNYNVAALTDEAAQIIEHYGIEPYGSFTSFTGKGADGMRFTSDDIAVAGSAVGNDVVFQGRTVDGGSGDYHFRHRQLGPVVGRFLGRDPIPYWRIGAVSAFTFLLNSPAMLLDPMGLEAVQFDWGEKGTISGTFELKYCSTRMGPGRAACGVMLNMTYKEKQKECCKNYRWKQTITTNDPAEGKTSPYVDCRNTCPWYDNFTELEDGITFSDAPQRPLQVMFDITWRAKLELKCLDEQMKEIKTVGEINWGFDLNTWSGLKPYKPQ